MVQLCILSDTIHLGQSSSFLHLHTSGNPKLHCNSITCCLQKGKSLKIFKFLWTISLTKQSLGSRHSGGLEAPYNIGLYVMSFMFKLHSSNLELYTKMMNGYLL